MKRRAILLPLSASFLAIAAAGAQQHEHHEDLGSVTFATSCTAEAQARMSRGVAMLHSFWFPEARRTFESVVEADRECGIAYWGVALTHFGNPMAGGASQGQQGWAAAQRAEQVGAKSDRERAYIAAALTLFRDHERVDNRARMRAYEAAMKEIVDRFPDDTEARIFHALFMVGNAPPDDMSFAQQKRAAEVLTALYREQPRHPGLAHYIIHAFDSPPLAHLALDAARQYASIAPAAPHALHMPSHTFTRLGLWDESIRTNRRSADLEATPGGKSHPLDYMVYAYLQQGRDEQARQAFEEIGGSAAGEYVSSASLTSYNALAMPARYALERDDWKGAAALAVSGGPPSAVAVTRFARALGAARSGDVSAAKEEVAALERIVAQLASQGDAYWSHIIDAQRLAVSGWVAHAEGRGEAALRLAREGAEKEDQMEKHPVTPGPLIPARELLADLLMARNQPEAALAEYELTLKREPNRARALVGAARAARAAGRADVARAHYRAVIDVMDPASARPELGEARAFVSPGS